LISAKSKLSLSKTCGSYAEIGHLLRTLGKPQFLKLLIQMRLKKSTNVCVLPLYVSYKCLKWLSSLSLLLLQRLLKLRSTILRRICQLLEPYVLKVLRNVTLLKL
jgi:hypothetical protein